MFDERAKQIFKEENQLVFRLLFAAWNVLLTDVYSVWHKPAIDSTIVINNLKTSYKELRLRWATNPSIQASDFWIVCSKAGGDKELGNFEKIHGALVSAGIPTFLTSEACPEGVYKLNYQDKYEVRVPNQFKLIGPESVYISWNEMNSTEVKLTFSNLSEFSRYKIWSTIEKQIHSIIRKANKHNIHILNPMSYSLIYNRNKLSADVRVLNLDTISVLGNNYGNLQAELEERKRSNFSHACLFLHQVKKLLGVNPIMHELNDA